MSISAADYAAEHGLQRVGARPGLWTYLKQTWGRRDFAFTLARSRIEARNQENRLGMLWEVVKPTLNAIMYGFIFGVIQGGSRPADFPTFVVIGVFLFEFFSQSMNQGARSITGNRALVQSLNFPRLTLPLATIIELLMTLAPMLLVMFVYVMILGHWPRVEWLLIIPLVVIFTVFNAGIAMVFARLTVHLQDITQILPVVTRLLFYGSGVLFAVDKILANHPALVKVFDFYPVYQVLKMARGFILGGPEHTYNPMFWVYTSVWAVVIFVFGLIFFWQAEERYGRVA